MTTDREGRVALASIAPAACTAVALPPALRIPAKIELGSPDPGAPARLLPYGRDLLATCGPERMVLLRMGELEGDAAGGDGLACAATGLRDAGAVAYGLAPPGATVALMWGGVAFLVPADAAGWWQAPFALAEIPGPEAVLYARVHGPAGGSGPAPRMALVPDTLAPPAPRIDLVGRAGDTLARGGLVRLAGSAEPGARVLLAWGAFRAQKSAGADGAWSLHVPAAALPAGIGAVCVAACDPAGRVGPATIRLARSGAGGAAWIGAAALRPGLRDGGGVELAGSAAPGCAFMLAWGGAARRVGAGPDGRWRARFAAQDLAPTDEGWLTAATVGAAKGGVPVLADTVRPLSDTMLDGKD